MSGRGGKRGPCGWEERSRHPAWAHHYGNYQGERGERGEDILPEEARASCETRRRIEDILEASRLESNVFSEVWE